MRAREVRSRRKPKYTRRGNQISKVRVNASRTSGPQGVWIMDKSRLTKVVGETLFVFGLLGGLYGVAIQITHPKWLTIQLTHLTPWLRVDIFAIISFILSVIGFIIWRYVRN